MCKLIKKNCSNNTILFLFNKSNNKFDGKQYKEHEAQKQLNSKENATY